MANWIVEKDQVGGNCCICSECGWFDWMDTDILIVHIAELKWNAVRNHHFFLGIF